VRRETRGEERPRRGLDVDDVALADRFDGLHRLGREVHHAPEVRELAAGGGPHRREEADAIGDRAREPQRARAVLARLDLESEAERAGALEDAIDGEAVHPDESQRRSVPPVRVEQAAEEPAPKAPAIDLVRHDLVEPLERGGPGRGRVEGLDAERREVLDRPRALVARRALRQRQPREISGAVVAVDRLVGHDGHAAERPSGDERVGPVPVEIPPGEPAMIGRRDHARARGLDAERGLPRAPDRLHDGRAELPERSVRRRVLVEPDERVSDAHVAERPPAEVRVQHGRLRREAVDARVLAAAIRVHAGIEADVGAVVASDDRAAGIGDQQGARIGLEVVVGIERRRRLAGERRVVPELLEATLRVALRAARPSRHRRK
jgi:hypothetical protein